MSITSKMCKCGHEYSFHVSPETLREGGCSHCNCKVFVPAVPTSTDKKRSKNMGKKLDENITTLKDFRYATKDLKDDTQIYVSTNNNFADESVLIEVTEVELILPKKEYDKSYLILRAR